MSQKRNRKPIGHVDWLRISRGSLYEKGFGIRSVSKLTLGFQAPFSVCFANPRSIAPRTAAGWSCALLPPFCCGKTSGGRCGALFPHILTRSFFPRKKRRTPAGDTIQAIGRPITQRAIGRVKRAEKRTEVRGASLLAQSNLPSFFHIACRNKPTKDWFSGGFGRGF